LKLIVSKILKKDEFFRAFSLHKPESFVILNSSDKKTEKG